MKTNDWPKAYAGSRLPTLRYLHEKKKKKQFIGFSLYWNIVFGVKHVSLSRASTLRKYPHNVRVSYIPSNNKLHNVEIFFLSPLVRFLFRYNRQFSENNDEQFLSSFLSFSLDRSATHYYVRFVDERKWVKVN